MLEHPLILIANVKIIRILIILRLLLSATSAIYNGIIVVVITHEQEVGDRAQRIIWFQNGQIRQ
ncbi:MAG: hypothetical protein AAGE84_23320 [Cyanobacteria bacterium P01_G01_bin.39]